MTLHPSVSESIQYLDEAEVVPGKHRVVIVAQRHGHENHRDGELTRKGEAQICRGLRVLGAQELNLLASFSSQEQRAIESMFRGLQCFRNGDDGNLPAIMHRDFGYGLWEDLGVTPRDLKPTKDRLIAAANGEHRNVKAAEWIHAWPQMHQLRQRMRDRMEFMLSHLLLSVGDSKETRVVYGTGHSCSLEIGLPKEEELSRIQMLEHGEILVTTWTVKDRTVTQIGCTREVRLPKPKPRKK